MSHAPVVRHVRFAALVAVLLSAAAVSPPPAAAQERPEFETTEIADGVYQFRFRAHNTFFVVTPEGAIAFDPISSEAARPYAEAIRERMPEGRLHALVYSHNHADHATGAPALFEELGEVPIIAHENAHAPIVERGSAEQPPPDITFTEKMVLRLGGRTIELHWLGPNHGDDVAVAYLPEERIAFVVDFVSNDAVGYRDLPGSRWPGLVESMERLQELDYERIVFGHGPPGDRASVERQIRYYRDLEAAVQEAIDRGLDREEAVREVELPAYRDWGSYGDWFGMNVEAMYRWLAEEGGG